MTNSAFWRTWLWTLQQLNRGIEQALTGMSTITMDWVTEEDVPHALTWTNVERREIAIRQDVAEGWLEAHGPEEATLRLLGLNFHEVARVLFSVAKPRVREVAGGAEEFTDDLHWAWMVLEDQRIEALLVDWYPEAIPALQRVGATLVTEYDGWFPAGQALLVRGLRHLPQDVRDEAADMFRATFDDETYDELCAIVDRYLELRAPDDLDEMLDLARQVVQLWTRLGIIDTPEPEAPEDDAIHPVMLSLLQLDAEQPGSIRPKVAARLCGHDPICFAS